MRFISVAAINRSGTISTPNPGNRERAVPTRRDQCEHRSRQRDRAKRRGVSPERQGGRGAPLGRSTQRRPIAVVGLTNSALPFVCFGFATLSITAGLASIFNAAAPLFGAVIAWLWLGDRLSRSRIAGLVIGLGGVLWLAARNVNQDAAFKPGGSGWAIGACLLATALYGFSANFTKKSLAGVAPLAVAAGSQGFAALFLLVPALYLWPTHTPAPRAWAAVTALAVLSTGVAYILYFRLIAHVGASNAIAVTFLIPVFGVVWGWFFLAENVTLAMGLGCVVIVIGTALASGAVRLPPFKFRSA